MGSVDYAAPEQFEGKALDARTDVYSLACLAFECLTGRVPYPRDQEAAVMYAHLRNPPPKVTEAAPGLPAGVDDVVATGMAKRPDDRYRSAGGLAAALRAALPPKGAGEAASPARSRRRSVVLGAGALAAAAAVVVLAPHLLGSSTKTPGPRVTLPSTGLVLRIDAGGRGVTASIHPQTRPRSIAAGGGFVWLGGNDVLEKIRGDTGAVVADIRGVVGACNQGTTCLVTSMVLVDGHLWAATPVTTIAAGGQIVEVDATTNRIVHRIDLPGATSMIFAEGSLWVTNPALGQVTRIDPTSRSVLATVAAESSSRASTIAGGEGAVWVVDGAGGTVTRIDAATNQVTARIPTENASAVAVGEGDVWTTSSTSGTVTEYDQGATRLIRTVHIGQIADSIVVANGSVWVSSFKEGTVVRLDPASGKILQTIDARPAPYAMAAGDGVLWVMEALGFAPG